MKNTRFTSMIATSLVALCGLVQTNTGWTKPPEEKVKDWIQKGSENLQKGVDEFGEDFHAIQNYLDNYPWKGVIGSSAASGPVVLKHLELNDHSKAVAVRPGEKIDAEVKCMIDPNQSEAFGVYRVVVGIKGDGPQAVIGNEVGMVAGTTREKFTLVAPSKPGTYEVRFRVADALLKSTALETWKDAQGREPDATTTIGIIIVK